MLHATTIYLHAETRHLAQNVGSIPRRKASQLILLDELFLDIRSQTPPERDGKREKTNTSASGRLAVSNSKGMVFRCGPCQHVDKAPINSPSPSLQGFRHCSESCRTHEWTSSTAYQPVLCIPKPIAASTSMTNFSLLIATSTYARSGLLLLGFGSALLCSRQPRSPYTRFAKAVKDRCHGICLESRFVRRSNGGTWFRSNFYGSTALPEV